MGSARAGSSGSTSPPLGDSSLWPSSVMTGTGWVSLSPVEILVQRACDPSLSEPPYPVHVELAEYINTKKANTPREAAMAAVKMVNHRNPHVSILALALLDSIVQSCGYPVHLQVATKEFLNELVRRFPERPPPFPGPVMQRILELIHSWKEGICSTSRWKEDLGNIRDMHRLLSFKGYRFNNLSRANGSNPVANVDNLKSPEELENEDREAQSAKLQELLRRGTPKDLAAAQELMKILAGAEPERKPDYKAQTLKELNKVEAKVILLNEMLDNVDKERGEQFVAGDVYDQVSSSISAATPKIQGWISDAEAHDPDSLASFLQINDQINNVIARYEAFKRGDYEAGSNPIPEELAGGEPPKSALIDWTDDATSGPAEVAPSGGVNELADIFGPSDPSMTTTQNTMSFGAQPPKASNADILSMFGQPAPMGSQLQQPQPRPMASGYGAYSSGPGAGAGGMMGGGGGGLGQWPGAGAQQGGPQGYHTPMGGQIMLPGTPQNQMKGLAMGAGASGTPTGTPSQGQTGLNALTPAPAPAPAAAAAPPKKDPFADLADLF